MELGELFCRPDMMKPNTWLEIHGSWARTTFASKVATLAANTSRQSTSPRTVSPYQWLMSWRPFRWTSGRTSTDMWSGGRAGFRRL